jgi:hypothetical protein
MPQIIVAADRGAAFADGTVTFRERVTVADFESQHFAAQLVERLSWAVEGADKAEQAPRAVEDAQLPLRIPGRAADVEPPRVDSQR